jgi:voltage-gated potassium channel
VVRDESISSGPEPKARVYGALFVTLLIFFAATPLVAEDGFIDLALNLMIIGALLNALRTVVQDWRIVTVAVLLGVGAIAERPILLLGLPLAPAIILPTLSMIGFFLVVTVPLLLDVYRATVVSFGTILGACSMFLVLGLTWYGIFMLIELAEPGSFAFAEAHASDVWQGSDEQSRYGRSVVARDQLFYFTFVTVTTHGFGDVLPVSALARTYTTLAAVFGQLFLAIMIARLVGIHIAHSRAPRDPGPG